MVAPIGAASAKRTVGPENRLGVMAETPDIRRLRDAGLYVDTNTDVSFFVGKPKSVPGNRRPGPRAKGYAGKSRRKLIALDSPTIGLWRVQDKWEVRVHEWVPGPGPGDFQKPFDTLDEAVSFILEYYFGDPALMNPPEIIRLRRYYKIVHYIRTFHDRSGDTESGYDFHGIFTLLMEAAENLAAHDTREGMDVLRSSGYRLTPDIVRFLEKLLEFRG